MISRMTAVAERAGPTCDIGGREPGADATDAGNAFDDIYTRTTAPEATVEAHWTMLPASSSEPVSARCKDCDFHVGAAEQLAFFYQNPTAFHLTIKHEVGDEERKKLFTVEPQSNPKKVRYCPHMMMCGGCGRYIGNEILMGPRREGVYCFSSDGVYLKCPQFGRTQPRWVDVARSVPSIEIRKMDTFYGSAGDSAERSRLGKDVLPTVRATRLTLSKVHLNELTRDKPRPYQVECFTVASLSNTIIYLPTGAGKTLVAAMVVSLMKRLNPQKLVVIIVDRIPLVFQQGEYLQVQTKMTVLFACGEMGSGSLEVEIMAHDALCCTAQVFLNFLDTKRVRMADVSCLVIDEMHHASKNHPYMSLLKEYSASKRSSRPLLLGLTASPASAASILDLIAKLADVAHMSQAQYFTPCLYFSSLQDSINRPQLGFAVIKPSTDEQQMLAIMERYVDDVIRKLAGFNLSVGSSALQGPDPREVHECRFFCKRLLQIAHDRRDDRVGSVIQHLSLLYTSFEMASVLGVRFARDFLLDVLGGLDRRPDLWTPDEIAKARGTCDLIKPFQAVSPKAGCLMSLLKQSKQDSSSRIIVFVQTKRTARWLCNLLNSDDEIRRDWNPAYFVGQAAGMLEGMSWIAEQQPLLNLFRNGSVKLLISTSVLQEGLDVPMCNKIILFDRSWSLTSFVQSRGRARHASSEYIVICSDEERQYYHRLIASERDVREAILCRIAQHSTLVDKALLICHFRLQTDRLVWHDSSGHLNGISADRPICDGYDSALSFQTIINIHNIDEHSALAMERQFGADLGRLQSDHMFCGHKMQRLVIKESSCLAGKQLSSLLSFLGSMGTRLREESEQSSELLFDLVLSPFESAFHSQRLFLVADSVSAGFMDRPNVFSATSSVTSKSVRLNFNLSLGVIEVVLIANKQIWRLSVPLSILDQFVVFHMKQKSTGVLLLMPLLRPPAVFYCKNQSKCLANGTACDLNMASLDGYQWDRASHESCTIFPQLHLSNCLCFHFELNPASQALLMGGLDRLRQSGIVPLYSHDITVNYAQADEASTEAGEQARAKIAEPLYGTSSMDPEAAYLLETLRSRCFVRRFDTDELERLSSLDRPQLLRLVEGLPLLLQTTRFASAKELLDPQVLAAPLKDNTGHVAVAYDTCDDPVLQNSAFVKLAILTPLRVYFAGEQMISKNRITRTFPPQHFMRMQFRDEDLSAKLPTSHSSARLADCFGRIADVLKNGMTIGGATYQFLAMSSSQLREHGCWFVRPFHHTINNATVMVDAEYIRTWCGDFSKIKNVAKLVARLGQSFSASIHSVSVASSEILQIADINREGPGGRSYCFTDGIGMISQGLAAKVATKLTRPGGGTADGAPCAYQIRLAGFKGVVAIDPEQHEAKDTDAANAADYLKLRPSMCKFESEHRALEVLNIAEYIPGYLNRQVIMILSGLGVSDAAFSGLQDAQLLHMVSMLLDPIKAYDALTYYLRPASSGLPRLTFCSSIPYSTEPFFRGLLVAVYRKQLSDLLTKSRIFNPQGRILMGTVDETGTLAEDEVFIQCTSHPRDLEDDPLTLRSSLGRFVVVGPVAIAKNPCMHPGDIRVLKAVDSEVLKRCRWDVIVFPAVGRRPIPDMCSGSDLDGDLYNITWAPDLIPPQVDPPMEYDAPPEKTSTCPLTAHDMAQFMIDFIANDQLGSIANNHVALVDQRPEGVRDTLCKALAVIFSLAVDFPKTGFVASIPDGASVDLFPDFMLKPERPSYLSDKIVGRMFRRARLAFDRDCLVDLPIGLDLRFVIDKASDGDDALKHAIEDLYESYRENIRKMLCRYGIRSEAQVLTGSLLDFCSYTKEEDAREAMQMVSAALQAIVEGAQEAMSALAGSYPRELVASTAYAVCYSFAANNPPPIGLSGHILSFAWLLGDELERVHSRQNFMLHNDAEPRGWRLDASAVISMGMLRAYQDSKASLSPLFADYIDRVEALSDEEAGLGCLAGGFQILGSTSFGLFTLESDINVGVSVPAGELSMLNQKLETIGNDHYKTTIGTYSVALCTAFVHATQSLQCRVFGSAEGLLLAWVVARWARAHHIVRSSTRQAGRAPLSALLTFMFEYLADVELVEEPAPGASGGYDRWLELYNELQSAPPSSFATSRIAERLLRFLQFVSCEDTAAVMYERVFPTEHVPPDIMLLVREAAFRSFHLLAQSLDVNVLWKTESVAGSDLASRRRPVGFVTKRSRRTASSLFMQGSSRVFFLGSMSSRDCLSLEFYQNRRRPQHELAQCFTAVPRTVSSGHAFCLTSFYNHCFRQLIKIGSQTAVQNEHPIYGALRGHLRLGRLYFTHLPRMFLEEGAATIELLHRALERAYEGVDAACCKELLGRVRLQDVCLQPMKPASAEDQNPFGDDTADEAQTVEELLSRQKGPRAAAEMAMPGKRPRASSGPMNSSFEPFIAAATAHRLLSFIEKNGFVADLGSAAGSSNNSNSNNYDETMVVSAGLFEANGGMACEYQLTYNLNECTDRPVKVSTRPIRWLNADVRNDQCDGHDWRFTVSSSRRLESVDVCPKIVDVGPSGEPVVCPEFRALPSSLDGLFVRRTRTRVYTPTPLTSSLLPAAVQCVLECQLELCLTSVAEYAQPDPSTGRFAYHSEKTEVDIVLRSLGWQECGNADFADKLIHAVWALACLLREL